jgi:hypothetical protein
MKDLIRAGLNAVIENKATGKQVNWRLVQLIGFGAGIFAAAMLYWRDKKRGLV